MKKDKSAFLVSPINYKGGYRIGNNLDDYIQFNLTYKPKLFHRICMKFFLGWYWFDK